MSIACKDTYRLGQCLSGLVAGLNDEAFERKNEEELSHIYKQLMEGK